MAFKRFWFENKEDNPFHNVAGDWFYPQLTVRVCAALKAVHFGGEVFKRVRLSQKESVDHTRLS